MVAHGQIAEDIVLCFVTCVVPAGIALHGQTVECCILVSSDASCSVFTRCRACTRLGPVEALEIVLEVTLQGHVLRSAARM